MRKVFGLIFLALLIGCSSAEGEGGARSVAEDYMDAVKSGSDSAYDYIVWDADGFIDVFDYEYLETLNGTKEEDTEVYTYDFWQEFYSEDYITFDQYKQYEKQLFHDVNGDYEILKDDNEEMILWNGETYKTEYTLLYNVEIANEAGEKIYKKAEITVSPDFVKQGDDEEYKDGYVVSDIYLR